MSDTEVPVTYATASTWSLLACRRLNYLSALGKANPCLRALLQHARHARPWVRQIKADLLKLQFATPKLGGLPSPLIDVDAWACRAIAHTGAWRTYLPAWSTSDSLVDGEPTLMACVLCGKLVAAQGMGAHLFRSHQHFMIATLFCAGYGICPVCLEVVPSRFCCTHHIHNSTTV